MDRRIDGTPDKLRPPRPRKHESTSSTLLSRYKQENLHHIKVLSTSILLPHNPLEHRPHHTLHTFIPPRPIRTHKLRIPRLEKISGKLLWTLEIPPRANRPRSDIFEAYLLDIRRQARFVRPIRSPCVRVCIAWLELPHRLLPRRIEAQFAPHAQAERASGCGNAVHFPKSASRVRGKLQHESAESVCEGAVGEGA